jgi:hypothetical protein
VLNRDLGQQARRKAHRDGAFICLPRFDAATALRLIRRERISNLYLVPSFIVISSAIQISQQPIPAWSERSGSLVR